MTLKIKMIAIALIGILLSYTGLIPGGWILWQDAEERLNQTRSASINNLFNFSVQGLYPQMESGMQDLTRNSPLKRH